MIKGYAAIVQTEHNDGVLCLHTACSTLPLQCWGLLLSENKKNALSPYFLYFSLIIKVSKK